MRSAGRCPPGTWLHRILAFWIISTATLAVHAAESPSQEYQIKAVFLFNFAQFVEWPPASFSSVESPLVIGVLGRDPFGSALEGAVQGERSNGRGFVVERYTRSDEIKNCHILFISQSEAGRLAGILNGLKGRSILTVSDVDGFTENGGMIRFVMEQNKIRFRINLDSAKASNLVLSSKLLRPAIVVGAER